MLRNSRFNPAPGIADFLNEFKRPNPYRWPILVMSTAPFALIFYWVSSETVYKDPERPTITYITTYDPSRTDEEIIASNIANQEVKDLREEQQEALAERKRELYKALGAAAGMDVDRIEREADERRAAEEVAEQARRDEMFGRSSEDAAPETGNEAAPQEGSAP